MKRLICLLVLMVCFVAVPHFQKTYAASLSDGVASEAGFHHITTAVGEKFTLTAPPLTSSLKWRSSAPSVASVDNNGKVTAKSEGTAVIYVTSASDSSVCDSWIIEISAVDSAVKGALSLNCRTLGLTIGQSALLTAVAEGTAEGAITWSSTDETVASVSSDGRVTAKANGTAVIYATSANGEHTASCMVYVIKKTISLPREADTLSLGQTLYDPASGLGSKVIWASSDPSVAVARRGFIESVGTGTATITAITASGTGGQCTVTVTAPEPFTSAYLSPNNPTAGEENTLVMVGSTQYETITVTVTNKNGKVVQTLTVAGKENYTEKSVGTRTVRIWSVPLTISAAGDYTIKCTCENMPGYSFKTRVLPAPFVEEPPTSSSNSSSVGNSSIGNSSVNGSSTGNSSTDGSSTGNSSTDSSSTGISSTDGSSTGNSSTDSSSTGISSTDGSSTDGSSTGISSTDGSSTGISSTDGSSIGNSSTDSSTMANSSADSSSSGSSSSGSSSTANTSSATTASTEASLLTTDVPKTAHEWYVSNDLLLFLTQYESLSATVYYDVVNVPTIGYGQALFSGQKFYNYQTHEEAWGNMCKLVNETFAAQLNKFVISKQLLLNQAQFDALTSYSYNMGAYCWQSYCFKLRTLLVLNPDVSTIDETQLKYAFGKQSWTGGTFYRGLYRRRMDEWEMFLTGNYAMRPANQMTGDFAVPSTADQRDPNKYKSDWHAQSKCSANSCTAPK